MLTHCSHLHRGRILSYNAANHSLLIENNGVLKAAVATSVTVQLTCTPIPGHEQNCPQEVPVDVSQGAGKPTKTVKATKVPGPQTTTQTNGNGNGNGNGKNGGSGGGSNSVVYVAQI